MQHTTHIFKITTILLCLFSACSTPPPTPDSLPCKTNRDCTDPMKSLCQENICTSQRSFNCETDADCSDPTLRCIAGRCLEQGTCKKDSDCVDPAMPKCILGYCDPVPKECQKDEHCSDPSRPICENETCVARPTVMCQLNTECSEGKVCVHGVCLKKTACTDDQVCTNQKKPFCETSSGTCVECTSNTHCSEWKFCDTSAFLCLNKEDACDSNEDCLTSEKGRACKDHQCVACLTNQECKAMQQCNSGQCVYIGCQNDQECHPKRCHPNTKECVQCIDAQDCPNQHKCIENQCTSSLSGCKNHSDCTSEKPVCDNLTKQCVVCIADSDCPNSFHCNLKTLSCTESPSSFCRVDTDCSPGNICDQQHCITGCRKDEECPRQTICMANMCQKGCRNHRDCPKNTDCIDGQCTYLCHEPDGTPSGYCLQKNKQAPYCSKGTCVQCTKNTHCQRHFPNKPTCVQNKCVCQIDSDCPIESRATTGYCESMSKTCYACKNDLMCKQGSICTKKTCVLGCRVDRDCPTGFCNSQQACVQCTKDAHCTNGTNTICSLEQRCVECMKNSDCPSDQPLCDLHSSTCFAKGKRTQCARCKQNADCGQKNTCLTVSYTFKISKKTSKYQEKACVLRCKKDTDCPQGFACSMHDKKNNAKFCWPSTGFSSKHSKTCFAYQKLDQPCKTHSDCSLIIANKQLSSRDGFCSSLDKHTCRVSCSFQKNNCPQGFKCTCPKGYTPSVEDERCRNDSGKKYTVPRCSP